MYSNKILLLTVLDSKVLQKALLGKGVSLCF